MNKSRTLLALLTAAVTLAPVAAEVHKGNSEFGMDVGLTRFDPDASGNTGWGVNLRGGYFLTSYFELEGQFRIAVTSEDPIDIGVGGLFADAVFNFRPTKRIVPHVYFGLGATRLDFSIDEETIADDTSLGYLGGVGSRFFLDRTGRFGLRADLSVLVEDTFDMRKSYTSLAAGFLIRLGS